MASPALLQALRTTLHISLSSQSRASRSHAATKTCTAALHSTRQGGPQRRQAVAQAIEAGDASLSSGASGAAVSGGGGSGGGLRRLAAALSKHQPDAAFQEFVQLLERGALPSASECDRLISVLCKGRRFRDAWRAYAAASGAGYPLQYNTYQGLISAALKAGEIDAALDAFHDLQGGGYAPNVVTYCGLISALARERRRGVRYAQTAHELWGELAASGLPLDGAAYRTGIKACVDVGRLREADRLLGRMAGAGAPPDARAYNILLAGHARAANAGAMARLLQRMTAAGVAASAVTYNTLIDGHVRAGDLAGAKAAAVQAAAVGIALDVWAYSTLIKGHVQAGQMVAAEAVLGDMAAAGVKPSCISFTTLIDGHARAGDMAAACRVLQAMQAAGETPNAVTYNTLLRGYAAQAAAAGAGSSSSSSSSRSATAASVAAVSAAETAVGVTSPASEAAAAASGALAAAQQLLADMQAAGVAPSVDTFNTLMSAAVAAGDCQLALDVQQRLAASGLRPDGLTYTTLIQAYGRMGRVAEAAGAFEALLRDRSAAVDVRAYNAMVDALARNGDMAAAERMLERATDLADRQGLPPPVEAFGAVVAGYARQLAVAPAVAAVKRFHAAGGSPDAPMLDILANIAIRAGDYRVAMQAVRALELIGREVDKAKYATLLEEVRARQAAGAGGDAASNADRPQHNRTWAEYQRRRDARRKNVQLERLKWLLGLPNSYYSSDSETDAPSSSDQWENEKRRWQNQQR